VRVDKPLEECITFKGLAGLAWFDFDDVHGPQSMSPAREARPSRPIGCKFGLRRAAEPTYAKDCDLHGRAPPRIQTPTARVGGSTDQIFSML
jgi:hypothetical protein